VVTVKPGPSRSSRRLRPQPEPGLRTSLRVRPAAGGRVSAATPPTSSAEPRLEEEPVPFERKPSPINRVSSKVSWRRCRTVVSSFTVVKSAMATDWLSAGYGKGPWRGTGLRLPRASPRKRRRILPDAPTQAPGKVIIPHPVQGEAAAGASGICCVR
jgi:hypothetical protein